MAARVDTLRRATGVLVLVSLVPAMSACSTAWARGIVRDQEGQPISGATVALSAAGSSVVASTAVSEGNGCFNVLASAKKEQETFLLTVRASGYKALSVSFPRRERLTATVTLLDEGESGDSSLTRVPASEEMRIYEGPCIPPPVPGAYSLGLR